MMIMIMIADRYVSATAATGSEEAGERFLSLYIR